jgi:hypothetical protein
MNSPERLISDGRQVLIEVRGPGEWIVGVLSGGRSLHVYRLEPADWLVSEVGRDNEGRGRDLKQALAALSPGVSSSDWWELLTDTLDGG